MYENCQNNFSSVTQSIVMLALSGVLWMLVVLMIERIKNGQVRKSEQRVYVMNNQVVEGVVEEKTK